MKEWQKQVEQSFDMQSIAPNWDRKSGVPFCTDEACPSYDGKRCRLIGFRPGNICEPAVIEMASMLEKGRGLLKDTLQIFGGEIVRSDRIGEKP